MIDRISNANIQSMIETLRAHQTQAAGVNSPAGEASTSKVQGQPDFFKAVQNALDKVNDADIKADALQEAYDRGEEVPLTEVVLSMQKSSLAFEATLQVRNKVMKAYEEIMNMPV
ncbi:flagellar hook-basal body complex protein FliE [Limnohabitans sp. MORI2]|jgi:flagellar hook-basal body complex protein FliE|uniref:flagellar hook-basal body complex protein FliE n=1 Tax=Limnohabitans sp. MORI2 TaxID=1751150 RepID=UPI0023779B06|nr:flagellar hook-basal body complex protein FliE [Limnohabitans sp. MORI2]BDU57541.1 flagellar hook-basal body complex protein FliE [Limnohabitans sp. MORI2]